jgi:hypothetical protein
MKKRKKRKYIAKAKAEQKFKGNQKMSSSSSSLVINVLVSKSEGNVIAELAQRCANEAIRACALHYKFSADEAIELLNLNVTRSEKIKTTKREAKKLPKMPIPFSGELVLGNCHGLKHNHGLFTQCYTQLEEGYEEMLCGSCGKQALKNTSGNPDCGRIDARLNTGLFEFRDPKGRKPVALTSLMKKMNLTREDIEEEAGKFNIKINPIHFEIPVAPQKKKKTATTALVAVETEETEETALVAAGAVGAVGAVGLAAALVGTRGRPKKASKVVSVDATEDLFASLVSSASAIASVSVSAAVALALGTEKAVEMELALAEDSKQKESKPVEEVVAPKKKVTLAKAEKDAAKAEKDAAKAEKDAALALAKAEKDAALTLAKAEKEAKKVAVAQAKAEKEAALAQAKAEKALAKAEAKTKADKKKAVAEPEPVALALEEDEASVEEYENDDEEEVAAVVNVKKFSHNGSTYLKSSENVIYTMDQELVGHWNEETKEIDVCDDDDEDEDEDEEEETNEEA